MCFGFYSCQQFKVSLLILYSDTREKHLGCLINKTVGLQYSLWSLPPGISMPQLSAIMADIWILMGIFLWVPGICCVLPYHCCCLQELAEQFVASIGHVKHSRVKVWSSHPILANTSYYFFEMSEGMEKKKKAAFFLLAKPERTRLHNGKAKRSFLEWCITQVWKVF